MVEWSEQLRSVTSVWLGAAAAAFKSDSAPAGVWARNVWCNNNNINNDSYYYYYIIIIIIIIIIKFESTEGKNIKYIKKITDTGKLL